MIIDNSPLYKPIKRREIIDALNVYFGMKHQIGVA